MDVGQILLPDLEEILRTNPEQARDTLAELHPADTADIIARMPPEVQARAIPLLTDEQIAQVMDFLGSGRRAPVFTLLAPDLQVRVAENMSADDRADMFGNLAPEIRDEVLSRLSKEEARDVRDLMHYPPTSAGGLMTTDVFSLPSDLTVGQVLELVRAKSEDVETLSYLYVTDRRTGKLMGVLSLRELVVNKPDRPIAEVMNPNVATVGPLVDQEEVARIIARYDYVALPVVDDFGKLLGIVTVDDMVDVVEAEGTEDIHRMGGIEPFAAPYFATPFWMLFRKRAGWLVVLLMGQMLTITALQYYDGILRSVDALIWFIPMIISSGGNSGSQTATLLVRGMAVGEIDIRSTGRVFVREFWMSLCLGVLLGTMGLARAWMLTGNPRIAATVGFSLLGVVVFGCITATALPLLLRRLGLDPAVSSTPFIASLVDVTGILIYVHVALWILAIVL